VERVRYRSAAQPENGIEEDALSILGLLPSFDNLDPTGRGADMNAHCARRIGAAMIGLSFGWWAPSVAVGQSLKDPPWNPDHIDHLPTEVRIAVLAMCGKPPSAGHYFATYSQNSQQINQHFEHFHCESGSHFCNASGCLHQVYALAAGHYHLAKSFYGTGND
jgi:hypothetical protein